jgi:hypothetical protein
MLVRGLAGSIVILLTAAAVADEASPGGASVQA